MNISHHIPARLMRAYAAGSLPSSHAAVVAAHVSLCHECRARLEAEEIAGGAVLEGLKGADSDETVLRDAVLAALDDAPEAPDEPVPEGKGIYPGPVMQALKGRPPRWKPLGAGIRQTILSSGSEGSLRLLYIPPGAALPDHGHGGLELTLLLQGSFDDETGHYGVGDVEVADDSLEHMPVAGPEVPCIALAATDAPLKFRALVPRLLQPLFRI